MYKKFFLEISNPKDINDSQILRFKLTDTLLAQKWANEINQQYDFYEQDRFTYWPNNEKDNEFFSRKLNEQIEFF